jgi:hypothetical protein
MKDKKTISYVFRILIAVILMLAMYLVQWQSSLEGFTAGLCFGIAIGACAYSVFCAFQLVSMVSALKKDIASKDKLLAQNNQDNKEEEKH